MTEIQFSLVYLALKVWMAIGFALGLGAVVLTVSAEGDRDEDECEEFR